MIRLERASGGVAGCVRRMGSLGLISFIVAIVAIPVVAARRPDPRVGVRRMTAGLFLAAVAYALFVALVYSPYFQPEAF